jgi:hypothetical protein
VIENGGEGDQAMKRKQIWYTAPLDLRKTRKNPTAS